MQLADIDEKRITFVSDTDVSIHIRWAAPAKDIKWNNAIAMAVTIARTIDKMNLWDGYLDFKVRTGRFKMNTPTFKHTSIGANLICDVQNPISFIFPENILHHKINVPIFMTTNISAELPCMPISSYNDGDTVIYIDMTNPITSMDTTVLTSAFEVTALFGGTMYTVSPKVVELSGNSQIKLTLDTFEQATGEINILYKQEVGNLIDCVNGGKVKAFSTSFTYATTYMEGE